MRENESSPFGDIKHIGSAGMVRYYVPDMRDIFPGYVMEVKDLVMKGLLHLMLSPVAPREYYSHFRTVVFGSYHLIKEDAAVNPNIDGQGLNLSVLQRFSDLRDSIQYGINDYHTVAQLISDNALRVQYLTKQQIISEGWEFVRYMGVKDGIQFKHGTDYVLEYYRRDHKLSIWNTLGKSANISLVLNCYCPSINEFRKVLSSLSISVSSKD